MYLFKNRSHLGTPGRVLIPQAGGSHLPHRPGRIPHYRVLTTHFFICLGPTIITDLGGLRLTLSCLGRPRWFRLEWSHARGHGYCGIPKTCTGSLVWVCRVVQWCVCVCGSERCRWWWIIHVTLFVFVVLFSCHVCLHVCIVRLSKHELRQRYIYLTMLQGSQEIKHGIPILTYRFLCRLDPTPLQPIHLSLLRRRRCLLMGRGV